MLRLRTAVVTAREPSWPGVSLLRVRLAGVPDAAEALALAYPALVGDPQPGERVLLNTSAVDLGLGTGGYCLVVARLDAPEVAAPRRPGHLVKARYTPHQSIVLGVEEPASPHRAAMLEADSLDGMPVLVADLHSSLPAIVAGILETAPGARVAYVMTDGASLPRAFSRTVGAMRDLLAGVVTVGQCFGGDLEAVTLHSGLLAARVVLGADVAVVSQGPGSLGNGTRWGFSGLAAGEAINAAACLGGHPIGVLRVSGADPRPRHRGLSHHSRTAYGRVALAAATLVLPGEGGLDAGLEASIRADLAPLVPPHRLVEVPHAGLLDALHASPVPLSSMGRGIDADPAYFVLAAAAGRHAATLVAGCGPADGF